MGVINAKDSPIWEWHLCRANGTVLLLTSYICPIDLLLGDICAKKEQNMAALWFIRIYLWIGEIFVLSKPKNIHSWGIVWNTVVSWHCWCLVLPQSNIVLLICLQFGESLYKNYGANCGCPYNEYSVMGPWDMTIEFMNTCSVAHKICWWVAWRW